MRTLLLLLVALPGFGQGLFNALNNPPAGGGGVMPTANRTYWNDTTQNSSLYSTYAQPPTGQPVTNGNAIASEADLNSSSYQTGGGDCTLSTSGLNSRDAASCGSSTATYTVVNFGSTGSVLLSGICTASDCQLGAALRITGNCPVGTLGNGYTDATVVMADTSQYFGIGCRLDTAQNKFFIYSYDGTVDLAEVDVSLNTNYVVVARHGGGQICISVNNGTEACTASGNTQVITGVVKMWGAIGTHHAWPGLHGEAALYNVGTSFNTGLYTYLAGRWI